MWQFLIGLFSRKKDIVESDMKKFLIVGLGNIGEKYQNTRHNIGFKILDYFTEKESLKFVVFNNYVCLTKYIIISLFLKLQFYYYALVARCSLSFIDFPKP